MNKKKDNVQIDGQFFLSFFFQSIYSYILAQIFFPLWHTELPLLYLIYVWWWWWCQHTSIGMFVHTLDDVVVCFFSIFLSIYLWRWFFLRSIYLENWSLLGSRSIDDNLMWCLCLPFFSNSFLKRNLDFKIGR